MLTANAEFDDRFSRSTSIVAQGIRSAMCVPMLYRGLADGGGPEKPARDPRGHVPRLQARGRRVQPARPGALHQHRQPGGAGAQERGARAAHPRGQGGRGQAPRAGGAQPAGRRDPARQRAAHQPHQSTGGTAARLLGAARVGRRASRGRDRCRSTTCWRRSAASSRSSCAARRAASWPCRRPASPAAPSRARC